jgi:hypothetical protein
LTRSSPGARPTSRYVPSEEIAGCSPLLHHEHWSARLQSLRVLRSQPAAAPRANGRPFLTCASAVVRIEGRRFVAAVLLDAKHPGDSPAPLPGAVRQADGSFAAFPAISAARSKDTWLVVRGTDDAIRREVLRVLSVDRRGEP